MMHRANVTKRPVIYNDRLSVLDFRPKKRKLNNKPINPSPLAVQTPTPTPSTLSETAGSENASPREDMALTWDAAEFTEDLMEKCATLLLAAVAEGLAIDEESSGSESESDDDDEVGEVDAVDDEGAAAVGSVKGVGGRIEENEVLLEIPQDDGNETDEDWSPTGKAKPKKSPKGEKRPQARRKAAAGSVTTPASKRKAKSLGEPPRNDASSAESTPRSSLRGRKSKTSL